MAGNAFGARFDANGGITADGRITDGRVEITTADALPLRALLPARWQATPLLWEAPLNLRADLSGNIENLAARLQLELGDLRLDTQQNINMLAGSGTYRLSAHHPGAQRLFTALGVANPASPGGVAAWAPDWPGEGSFSLQAQGNWRDQALAFDTFQLTAGGLRGNGQLNVGLAMEQPVVSGRFHAEALPLPMPAGNADAPLPVRLAQAIQVDLRLSADEVRDGDRTLARQATCTLSITRAQASLESCTMRIGGGAARLDATLSKGADLPRVVIKFSVDDARLGPVDDPPPFGILDGLLTAHISLNAEGYSFGTLRDTAAGDAELRMNGLVLSGMDLAAINDSFLSSDRLSTSTTMSSLRASLLGGTTLFDEMNVSAVLGSGIIRFLDGRARGSDGALTFGSSVDIRTGSLDGFFEVSPVAAPTSGLEVRLSGLVASPERTVVLLRTLRWLAERPR